MARATFCRADWRKCDQTGRSGSSKEDATSQRVGDQNRSIGENQVMRLEEEGAPEVPSIFAVVTTNLMASSRLLHNLINVIFLS